MKPVKFYTNKINLATYPVAAEDREPPLLPEFTPRGATIYPYTTQEVLSNEAEMREYKALYLENEYIKLTFLPELNGRLYSAFDKVNGNELFYANPAIKTGLFAVRGAWAAVGVEFNFPNSHTSTTLDPVEYETKKYEDGSVSILLGDIENTCRMGWSVECKLRPNSSAIETEIKLYNPTEFAQRYYYWTNAACAAYDETEFIFPESTAKLLTHPPMDASRLARIDYPVNEGKDISFFKNIKQHFPVFAENMDEDFFGLYHHNLNYGVAHVADHSLVRGRKLWTFGTARDGRIFIDQLSNDGSDYCELQTGPFSLQSDYRLLQPGRMQIQKEYWLPVANTDGFNLACREFSAKISDKEIKLCAAEKLSGIEIKYIKSGKEIHLEKISVEPCRMISISNTGKQFDSLLFCRENGEQITGFFKNSTQEENENIDNSDLAVSNILQGKYYEEQDNFDKALIVYEENSLNEPECALAAARLSLSQGLYAKSEAFLQTILKVDCNNSEALIMQGIIHCHNDKILLAERAFSRAADDNRFRDRALLHLAKTSVTQKNYKRALDILEEVKKCGISDPKISRLQLYCSKKLDMKYEAENTFFVYPLMENIGDLIELADYNEALSLVKADDAESCYYRAWLNHMNHNENAAKNHLYKAKKADWTSQFAFRLELEPILRYALEINPNDFTANYQLGCLLASKKRWDEASVFWEQINSGKYHTDSLRNLALYHWKVKKDLENAKINFEIAAFANDAGARTVLEAEMFFKEIGDLESRIKLFDNNPLIESDSRLQLAHVKILLDNDDPEKAYELLSNCNFRLCEGKMLSRNLYERACETMAFKAASASDLEKADLFYTRAAEYPENIGIGKPSGNKEAKWHYLRGISLLQLDKDKEAGDSFNLGAEQGDWLDIKFFPIKTIIPESPWENIDVSHWINIFFRSLCSEKTGLSKQAEELKDYFNQYLEMLKKQGRDNHLEYKELSILNKKY